MLFSTSARSGANGFAINGFTSNPYLESQSSCRPIIRPVSFWMSENPSLGPNDFPFETYYSNWLQIATFCRKDETWKIICLGERARNRNKNLASPFILCDIWQMRQTSNTNVSRIAILSWYFGGLSCTYVDWVRKPWVKRPAPYPRPCQILRIPQKLYMLKMHFEVLLSWEVSKTFLS